MNETALLLWESVFVQVTDVRHGLLIRQQACVTQEGSMFLLVRGQGAGVTVGRTPYRLRANAAFHVAGSTGVALDAGGGELEYDLVAYRTELPQSAGRAVTRLLAQENPFEQNLAAYPQSEAAWVCAFRQLEEAWRRQKPGDGLLMKGLLYTIAHAFFEGAAQGAPAVDGVEAVREYLEEHFAQECSIQALADAAGMSRTSLHERFRRRFGVSPQQYLTNLRLDAACEALREGRLSIPEIAASCGMRSRNYFFKLYRQRFGVTPGAYRQQHALSAPVCKQPVRRFAGHGTPQEEPGVLIENFGRIHHYRDAVECVVCLSYSAAELVAALGAGERIVGLAGAEESLEDCDPAYRQALSAVTLLPPRSAEHRAPTYAAISACRPQLVIGTSYSFHAHCGVEDASAFERNGIHIYALTATCRLDSTLEDVRTDILNLGSILGCGGRAQELADSMRRAEEALPAQAGAGQARVFVYDSDLNACAFTCGRSLESHLIHLAGGVNVFGDRPQQFAPVTWAQVAQADPDVILVHSFYGADDGRRKAEALRARPELAGCRALSRIHVLGIKRIFPGLGNVDTVRQMAAWFSHA